MFRGHLYKLVRSITSQNMQENMAEDVLIPSAKLLYPGTVFALSAQITARWMISLLHPGSTSTPRQPHCGWLVPARHHLAVIPVDRYLRQEVQVRPHLKAATLRAAPQTQMLMSLARTAIITARNNHFQLKRCLMNSKAVNLWELQYSQMKTVGFKRFPCRTTCSSLLSTTRMRSIRVLP
jgi:hypothetical protein